MFNSNLFYVGVLGLKSNFRGQELLQRISKLGLAAEITWGISSVDLGSERLYSFADQRQAAFIMGRELTPQEISCALGHLEMYERFLMSGKEFGLFFEDDADFDEVLSVFLSINFPKKSKFILQLGGYFDPNLLPNPFPVTLVKRDDPFRSRKDILQCLRYPTYAHGYITNRVTCKEIVHLMRGRKINTPADFPFAWRSSVPFYITVRQVIWQRSSPSGIEEGRSLAEIEKKAPNRPIRWIKTIYKLTPLHLWRGMRLGLSGRAIFRESILYYILSKYYHA